MGAARTRTKAKFIEKSAGVRDMSSKMEGRQSSSAANYGSGICYVPFYVMEDIGENATTTGTSLSAETIAVPKVRDDHEHDPESLRLLMRRISETARKTQLICE